MTKTRPAPLGATYKWNVRPSWLSSRPDVAPNGARRVLFDPSYKDLAPTELYRGIAKGGLLVTTSNPLKKTKAALRLPVSGQILVNFVSLADVASRVYHITGLNGAKSALW